MALQGGSAECPVHPADPAAAPAGVTKLPRRYFLVSAFALKRALKAEVGVLLSMLFASPLGSRRLFGLFSSEVQGITASHQALAESLSHQRKPTLLFCFKFLVVLCLFILCYTMSSNSPSWLYNDKGNLAPPYRVHPRLKVKQNEIHENTKPHPVQTAVRNTFPSSGTTHHLAYPRNYHFIMDNAEVCKNKTPFLVLMVPVAPQNVDARDAIRKTWGKENLVQGEVVFTLFMLGLAGGAHIDLEQENQQHHDLIQSNFMDTYLNLTVKTMVIMDWLATRCPTAAYAMKIDSDMFLNIDNLVIMLKMPGIPKLNYLTGMLMWNRPVVRSKASKWYVPEEMYPDPKYPTYTLGMGYVFSNDLPEKFVNISKSIKPFNIEDAYIGMCMKKLGLTPTSPPNPSQFKAYNTKYNRCEYSKIITYILGSSQELVNYWTDLKRPGPPC
eukprot:superscaffoldBa00004123_g18319